MGVEVDPSQRVVVQCALKRLPVRMLLSSLPIDVLAQITSRIHYLDSANLWLCGSSLNQKLASGGIAELRIRFGSKFRPFTGASVFRQWTRITRFEIEDEHAATIPQDTLPILIAISNTVREMILHCSGSFWLLQDIVARNPAAFPAIETLDIIDVEVSERSGHIQWPKSLLTLSLSPTELDLDISSLPPNLTILNADFRQLAKKERVCFPQSLISLRLHLNEVPRDFVSLIPTNLEDLYLSGASLTIEATNTELEPENSSAKSWSKLAIPRLPRTLIALNWPFAGEFSREDLKAMPPALTELSGAKFALSDLDVLPPLLTHVPGLFRTPLQKHHCSSLPRGLKSLVLESSALPHLNPNTDLHVVVVDEIDGLIAELKCKPLSPHLTSLTFETTKDLPWEALPKTLKTLTFNGGFFDDKMAKMLPRDLKSLQLSSVDVLGADTLKELPRRLESLSMHSAPVLPVESSTWLPLTLLSLTIYWRNGLSSDWLKGLPTSLTLLRIPLFLSEDTSPWQVSFPPNLLNLTLFATFSAEIEHKAMESVLSALPQKLETFSISHPNDRYTTKYSYSLLSHIPKSLTRLRMPKMEDNKKQDEIRALLPPRIISAYFGSDPLSRLRD